MFFITSLQFKQKIDLQPLCRPPQLWHYTSVNAVPTFPNWCFVRIFALKHPQQWNMSMNEYKGLTSPAQALCQPSPSVVIFTHCAKSITNKPQQQKLPVGTVPLCSPNSKFCPCLPPFSCWKYNIPNCWWLPSFLQSSAWSCFSVTLGKPRSETLHFFHFSSFSSEWTRSCLTLLVRAVVLIFEEL